MKKILKYIGIILIFLMIPAALLFVPIGNNLILQKHTNELKELKLNSDYEILAIDSECGKLIGNGNGMQYFSALLIHSKETLKWENDVDNYGEGVFLVSISDEDFADFIGEYYSRVSSSNIKKKLKELKITDDYYVLYSFYNADLNSIWNDDLRAH